MMVNITFEEMKDRPDDFNVKADDKVIGTFYWVKKLLDKAGPYKVAVVHDLDGNVAIMPNEKEAVRFLAKQFPLKGIL